MMQALGRWMVRSTPGLKLSVLSALVVAALILSGYHSPQAFATFGSQPSEESTAESRPVQPTEASDTSSESMERPEGYEEVTSMKPAEPTTIFDFSGNGPTGGWFLVNDTVMGGVSQSALVGTVKGTAVFSGVLSLENNGGFASVRSMPQVTPLGDHAGIELRVRGDGSRYQFRLRTDGNLDGVAYSADFDTVKDEWLEIRLPFTGFSPTFRGRVLGNYPPLDPDHITTFGLMITDKQAGRFRLEMTWIRAYGES